MTPTEQDNELRALLDEFVLYTDSNPESNEPTELKLFLEQCDFPDAIDRLYSELMQLITADRKRVALEARIDSLLTAKRRIYETDAFELALALGIVDSELIKLGWMPGKLKAQQEEV